MEDRNVFDILFYASDEYLYYNNQDFKAYSEYLETICKKINNIDDDEIKYIISNNKLRNLTYKTIGFNNFYVYLNDETYRNILLLLYYRDFTRYDLNDTMALTLNIIYDNSKFEINTNELKKICDLHIFKNKYIRIMNNQQFVGDLYDFCINNDYKIIYELEDISEINNNKFYSHINITDNNVDKIDNIIKKCTQTNMMRLYVTPKIIDKENLAKYRKILNECILKYNDDKFVIINDDFIPGSTVGIDENNNIYLKFNFENKIFLNKMCINNNICDMKKYCISNNYILDCCVNCDENILCLYGISDKECKYKLF